MKIRYEVPLRDFFYSLLLLPRCHTQIFSSAPYSQKPSTYVLSFMLEKLHLSKFLCATLGIYIPTDK